MPVATTRPRPLTEPTATDPPPSATLTLPRAPSGAKPFTRGAQPFALRHVCAREQQSARIAAHAEPQWCKRGLHHPLAPAQLERQAHVDGGRPVGRRVHLVAEIRHGVGKRIVRRAAKGIVGVEPRQLQVSRVRAHEPELGVGTVTAQLPQVGLAIVEGGEGDQVELPVGREEEAAALAQQRQQPHLLKPEYASQVEPVASGWHPETVRIGAFGSE